MANPTAPIITFKVNVASDNISYLAPARHQNDQDQAITDETNQDSQKSTWFPNILNGSNIVKHNNDTFTAYGLNAKYIKDTYTTGANPLLSVVSETFASA